MATCNFRRWRLLSLTVRVMSILTMALEVFWYCITSVVLTPHASTLHPLIRWVSLSVPRHSHGAQRRHRGGGRAQEQRHHQSCVFCRQSQNGWVGIGQGRRRPSLLFLTLTAPYLLIISGGYVPLTLTLPLPLPLTPPYPLLFLTPYSPLPPTPPYPPSIYFFSNLHSLFVTTPPDSY